MNNSLKLINNNFLIIIFFIFIIILKIIYSFNNGYVAPDTEWFLKIAELLYLNQSLFYIGSINMPGYETEILYDNKRFAGTWPPLYPICIALIKFLTNLSYFWSSKIVNILCFICLFFYFNKKFNNKIFSYLILLNATLIEVLCFSLTEYLFLTLIIFSTDYFYKFIKERNIRYLLFCFIFTNLLFLTRYNGFYINFVFLLYSFIILVQNKKITKNELYVLLFLTINFLIYFFYLYLLQEFTGSYSGSTNRVFRKSYLYEIIYIIKSFVVELNYIISDPFNTFKIGRDNIFLEVVSILFILIIQVLPIFFLKIKINFSNIFYFIKNNNYIILYLINIFIYFISINVVIIIWLVDHLYYRSMSPISIMTMMIILTFLKSNTNFRLRLYYIYLIILSVFTNFFIPIILY